MKSQNENIQRETKRKKDSSIIISNSVHYSKLFTLLYIT